MVGMNKPTAKYLLLSDFHEGCIFFINLEGNFLVHNGDLKVTVIKCAYKKPDISPTSESVFCLGIMHNIRGRFSILTFSLF